MTDGSPRIVSAGGKPIATLVGEARPASTQDGFYQLSRFAYVRRDGGDFVLESPMTPARVVLHDPRALAALDALRRPRPIAESVKEIGGLEPKAANAFVALLREAGVLTKVGADEFPEDESASLRSWEFHDLLFHARSRAGRHDYPAGGTYRFAGVAEPPPALVSLTSDVSIPLAEPDLDRLEENERSLSSLQEARMSVRRYGEEPLPADALGEFLYRVGRVIDYSKQEAHTPRGVVEMDFAPRPYPAGGSLYELELYVAVQRCRDLDPGLYRYDPQYHRLDRVSEHTPDVDGLIADGARAAAIRPESVQVLIIVSARFARIAWKYETLAYSLILKNLGGLYQTMYLVATSMGLAPCALGRGDSDRFARAAGTDYYAETSVGEFLLGSLPD
jgi:SagB-type dehydrogenase family enzyme